MLLHRVMKLTVLMKQENNIKPPGLSNEDKSGDLLEWDLVYMFLDRITSFFGMNSKYFIVKGLKQRQDEIRILSRGDSYYLKYFLEEEVLRNPEFFYVTGFKYYIRGDEITVIPKYIYSFREVQELTEHCTRVANCLISRINTDNSFDKVKIIHDLLVRNVAYENDGRKERHNIIGPLIEKKSVCDGFSAAFKFLLDRIGIPCIIVTGTAWDQQLNSDGNHAWNMVKIENHWTHIDVTFDTTISSCGIIRYDYFGLATEKIQIDHKYNKSNLPEASPNFEDYYTRQGAVVYGKRTFQEYTLNMIKRNIYDFVVKLPYEAQDSGIENKVYDAIRNMLAENNLNFEFWSICNVNQMVFQFHFNKIQKI